MATLLSSLSSKDSMYQSTLWHTTFCFEGEAMSACSEGRRQTKGVHGAAAHWPLRATSRLQRVAEELQSQVSGKAQTSDDANANQHSSQGPHQLCATHVSARPRLHSGGTDGSPHHRRRN